MLGRNWGKMPPRPDTSTTFLATTTIHSFPVPAAPRAVAYVSRTLSSITVQWEAPGYWGGCALKTYEVQLREITKDGVEKEWVTVKWVPAYKTRAAMTMQIHSCDVRVRAYNVGSSVAGEGDATLPSCQSTPL